MPLHSFFIQKMVKNGAAFMKSFVPCGYGGFSSLWFCRLRGARQGGAGYGASPPSRPPLHPPRTTPCSTPTTKYFFRERLRTNLADVSASVLYNAAPGNGLHFA